MLTRIDLEYFKCFKCLRLPLGPLTLLSGTNASGKSSVMQALALLHQTMGQHEWSQQLMLNGSVMSLGTVADVVDQVYGRHDFIIGLLDGKTSYQWRFTGEQREDMAMQVSQVKIDDVEQSDLESLHCLLPFFSPKKRHLTKQSLAIADRLRNLTYLTAERLGPRELYPLEGFQLNQSSGSWGELAISSLYSGQDDQVLHTLALSNVPPNLFRQVEERMKCFFPGCVLNIDKITRTNNLILGIRTSNVTDYHRPINTGFGLTQVLPVVVAALSAQKEELLLIENPAVHLHPAGQARMGHFLAEVAAAGVQVLIETHSDHVLNGIRRAVKDNTLSNEDVHLHFFRPRSPDPDTGEPQVESPEIDANGSLDYWPDGFFDQFDKDMNYFAGWG